MTTLPCLWDMNEITNKHFTVNISFHIKRNLSQIKTYYRYIVMIFSIIKCYNNK